MNKYIIVGLLLFNIHCQSSVKKDLNATSVDYHSTVNNKTSDCDTIETIQKAYSQALFFKTQNKVEMKIDTTIFISIDDFDINNLTNVKNSELDSNCFYRVDLDKDKNPVNINFFCNKVVMPTPNEYQKEFLIYPHQLLKSYNIKFYRCGDYLLGIVKSISIPVDGNEQENSSLVNGFIWKNTKEKTVFFISFYGQFPRGKTVEKLNEEDITLIYRLRKDLYPIEELSFKKRELVSYITFKYSTNFTSKFQYGVYLPIKKTDWYLNPDCKFKELDNVFNWCNLKFKSNEPKKSKFGLMVDPGVENYPLWIWGGFYETVKIN